MKACSGILVFFLVAGVFGCTSSHKVTRERTLSLDEVMKRVQERNNKIQTLNGSGTITIESLESSNSGSFTVNLKKPDSLLMEFRGPFGIRGGTLMLTREQFNFYNWMENTAIVDKPDGETLNSLFRLNLQFEHIVNSFTGETQKVKERDTLEKFSVENNRYVARYRSGDARKEYWIDGDDFLVTDYRFTNERGENVIVTHASDVVGINDVPLPKFFRVVFLAGRSSITIAYDELIINEHVTCIFDIPKHAEIIDRR